MGPAKTGVEATVAQSRSRNKTAKVLFMSRPPSNEEFYPDFPFWGSHSFTLPSRVQRGVQPFDKLCLSSSTESVLVPGEKDAEYLTVALLVKCRVKNLTQGTANPTLPEPLRFSLLPGVLCPPLATREHRSRYGHSFGIVDLR
jgi:hypothetical protein